MIHAEILVEDLSGKIALEEILPNLGLDFTYRIKSYRGIGRLPKGLGSSGDPQKRILLDQLPRLITGYGNSFASDPDDYIRYVIIICDLDNRDEASFRSEIMSIIDSCYPKPRHALCFAIEEGEAWLLGDMTAVTTAYPKANMTILTSWTPARTYRAC